MDDLRQRPIRTQADLQDVWRRLMWPLGFDDVSIWFLPIGGDHRPAGLVTEVAEMPSAAPDDLGPLLRVISLACREVSGLSVAFLRSRPGAATITADDVSYALGLAAASRQAGIDIWPLHVAGDDGVAVVPPDSLAAVG